MQFNKGYLLWYVMILTGMLYAVTGLCDEIIGRSGFKIQGGIYVGKVQPYYWDQTLYLKPVNPVIKSSPPNCIRRNLLRLQGDATSIEFINKFNLLFHSWINDREVILGGTGTCTAEGDELIKVVMPK